VFRGAGAANQQTSLADLAWWEVYKDDTLKDLVKTAMANNYDIRVAAARVEQEREIVAQTRALYFPGVSYLTNLTYGKNQFQYSPSSNTKNPEGFLASLALATWEVDIWGRIRRSNEAARAQYLASYEVRRGVMLSVMCDVSESYLTILGLQLQLNIARQAEQAFGGIRKLFEERFQGGDASKLPVSRAAADEAEVAGHRLERFAPAVLNLYLHHGERAGRAVAPTAGQILVALNTLDHDISGPEHQRLTRRCACAGRHADLRRGAGTGVGTARCTDNG